MLFVLLELDYIYCIQIMKKSDKSIPNNRMLPFLNILFITLVVGYETPTKLYELETDVLPAFCNIIKNPLLTSIQSEPVYDLIYSSFTPNPFQLDPIYRVEALNNRYQNEETMSFDIISDELTWPNELSNVPANVFSSYPYMVAASTGFFVPGKQDGEIAILDLQNIIAGRAKRFTISSNKDGIEWYYHRVEWHDMNGDGYLDAVTERANGGGPSADITQLVWLENPGGFQITEEWDVHVIKENSEDVHFRLHPMKLSNGREVTSIISSCFYSNELTIVWSDTDDYTDDSSIRSIVVDTYGWYFDVQIIDVNNDGYDDLLTSTWSQAEKPGAVIAYEIPTGDWTTEPWPRHILQDGYKNSILAGAGSPGAATAFWPSKASEINKPYIMVSGDDDGNAYVLTANSEDRNDWTYKQHSIAAPGGTVGMIGVEDVDHDGYAEVFIPAYTARKIIVMTYKK